MLQSWHDLLFAHWPLEPAAIQPLLPSGLVLETFDGAAWLGVVPFRVELRVRWLPPLPGASAFPELNVRTYVRAGDRPGVYFFSLDAGNALAVRAARILLNLPYYPASMTLTASGNGVDYRSRRDTQAEFSGRYEPTGARFVAAAGSLEYFLTERYCLYHLNHRGRPYRLDIHHPPWPLQPASAELHRNTMADVNGLSLPAGRPLLHFAKRQDMVAWAPSGL